MSLKDKLKAKSGGLGAAVDEELAKGVIERSHPRTAVGQAGAFQLVINESDKRIAELEARVKDLESTALPLDQISPNPWQPRRVFDEAELQKLAGSIAEAGLIQPIILRSVWNPDTSPDPSKSVWIPDTRYQIVAGERRWRAHQVLGRTDIKAIVITASDDEMAALALAENFDREDLTAYEIALAIRNAETAFPTKKRLAATLGINRTDLYKYLAFFDLPAAIIADLEATPGLLGRDSASDIAAVIKKHETQRDAVNGAVIGIWARYKAGGIDQGKLAAAVETVMSHGKTARTERDIKKLFIGKEQAGSITRDASALTIKIRNVAISSEKESRLRHFVQQLLVDPD